MQHLVLPRPWKAQPRRLFDLLGHDNLRAVGGCVRNALLKTYVKDIDFATVLTPDEVTQRLHKEGIRVVPTGLLYGTVTAVMGKTHFEITTLRRDVETDGRRAVVSYTQDWREDAQRRDFTVNALYADAECVVHDGTGQGLADLRARRLVFIGNAEERIREDYLRILRLFRFVAQLKGFKPDNEGLEACRRQKDGLKALSAERVTEEWLKLLHGRCAATALGLLEQAGIASVYDVVPDAGQRLRKAHTYRKALLSDALLLVLAFGKAPPAFRLSRLLHKRVETLLETGPSHMAFEEIVYRHGAAEAFDAVLWRAIIKGEAFDGEQVKRWAAYRPPLSPVNSQYYINQGLSGPDLGRAIKQAEEEWIARTFRNKE